MSKVLLSNDDGYLAPGLITLKDTLRQLGEIELVILAPSGDQSACSSSLNSREDLYCFQHSPDHYHCDASSASCAHLGINGFFDFTPHYVVSGINNGANMGDDALYSGTLAAALEGRFLPGISLAFSLACKAQARHFDTAAAVARKLVPLAQTWSLPAGLVLNVNIPDRPLDRIKAWRVTRLGHRLRSGRITRDQDEDGCTYYRLGMMGHACFNHPHAQHHDDVVLSDFEAVAEGSVSITPICADMTFVKGLAPVGANLNDVAEKG